MRDHDAPKTARYHPVQGHERSTLDMPMLTIIYHPDTARIGEYAHLTGLEGGRSISLGRHELVFCAPGHSHYRPLDDVYISRTPLTFSKQQDYYQVSAGSELNTVEIESTSINGSTFSVHTDTLQRGVVLCLSERVVLLWHRAQEPEAMEAGDTTGLLGNNASIAEIRHAINQVSPLNTDVLLLGESGTGKELVAKAIHEHGRRAAREFIPVNMSAIPSSLAASELFGAEKGAYTGSTGRHVGYFGQAERGTLFLDEIGDASLEVQAALLRALESREMQPVGGSPVQFDVRVVSATDADLTAGIQDQSFKSALRYRLGTYEIILPPLRERRSDIGFLAKAFFEEEFQFKGEGGRLDEDPKRPQTTCQWATLFIQLVNYAWPGNVRELRNVVRSIVIHCLRNTEIIVPSQVHAMLTDTQNPPASRPSNGETRSSQPSDIVVSPEQLRDALRESGWEPAGAARVLGISRQKVLRMRDQDASLRTVAELTQEEIKEAHENCRGDIDSMSDQLQVSRPALKRRLGDSW